MSQLKAGFRVVVVRDNHPDQGNFLFKRGAVTGSYVEGEYEVGVRLDGDERTSFFDASELELESVYDALSAKPVEETSPVEAQVDSRLTGEPGPEVRFITKDSGSRQEFESGMVRDADGETKDNFFLMIHQGVPYEEQFLTRFAQLLTRGAQKYSKRNFELADSPAELERAQESLFRHLVQYLSGDKTEDHAMAICFNVMLAELVQFRIKEKESKRLGGTV